MALLACCISLELFLYYSNMIWRIFSSSQMRWMIERTSRFTPLATTRDILSWCLPFGEDLFPSFTFLANAWGKNNFFVSSYKYQIKVIPLQADEVQTLCLVFRWLGEKKKPWPCDPPVKWVTDEYFLLVVFVGKQQDECVCWGLTLRVSEQTG